MSVPPRLLSDPPLPSSTFTPIYDRNFLQEFLSSAGSSGSVRDPFTGRHLSILAPIVELSNGLKIKILHAEQSFRSSNDFRDEAQRIIRNPTLPFPQIITLSPNRRISYIDLLRLDNEDKRYFDVCMQEFPVPPHVSKFDPVSWGGLSVDDVFIIVEVEQQNDSPTQEQISTWNQDDSIHNQDLSDPYTFRPVPFNRTTTDDLVSDSSDGMLAIFI